MTCSLAESSRYSSVNQGYSKTQGVHWFWLIGGLTWLSQTMTLRLRGSPGLHMAETHANTNRRREVLPALNSWAGAGFTLTNQGSEDASLRLSSGLVSIGLY